MRYLFVKDRKRRILFNNLELKRLILKSITYNRRLPYYLREQLFIKLNKINKNSSISRIRNRCLFTNRSRFILTKYKITRHYFKLLVSKGYLSGISKGN